MTPSLLRTPIAILALWLMAIAMPARAELLANPGFESGSLVGWTSSGLSFVTNHPDFVHDGSFGAKLDSGISSPGTNASILQSVALPSAGQYEFGGWLRAFTVGSPSGVFDQIQISTFVSITNQGGTLGGSVVNFSNFQPLSITLLTSGSDWAFFSGKFDYTGPPGGIVLLNFNLQNEFSQIISVAAGDSFFLRSAEAPAELPEPTSIALLGAALAGLGFALRGRK